MKVRNARRSSHANDRAYIRGEIEVALADSLITEGSLLQIIVIVLVIMPINNKRNEWRVNYDKPCKVVQRTSLKFSNLNGVRKPRDPNLKATIGGTFS